MDSPTDPDSPASPRRTDALRNFYHHYPPPNYPDPVYQPTRDPSVYLDNDFMFEVPENSTDDHANYSHLHSGLEVPRSYVSSNVALSGQSARAFGQSRKESQTCDCCPNPDEHLAVGFPKTSPPATIGRATASSRMPLASIPFFENLNTPSPPRRADHLVNRKTRFEREMDNLADAEEKEKKKRDKSPSIKKASALEGADNDDKYVGPWVLGKVVGKGASGRVRLARSRWSRVYAAIKIVPSANFKEADPNSSISKERKALEREVGIMKLLNHPNLMKLYDVYELQGHFYIALEFVAQGELFDYINAKRFLETNEASFFYQQLINGLQYLHSFGICHRDLKPENLLLDDDLTLKIADFGMASFQAEDEWLRTSCGSPHYASPEIISGAYYHGAMVDVWSSGVILYALLCGRLPFDDPHVPTVMKLASRAEYYIPPEVPQDAANLIERIFVVNQNMRIGISHIVSHPFLRRVWVPDRGLPARRVPVGPRPFNPYAPIEADWDLTIGGIDLELVSGVCAIMRTENVPDMIYRIHSSCDIWARRFYHLLKIRKDRIEMETQRLEQLRQELLVQARSSPLAVRASPVSHRDTVESSIRSVEDKENTPPNFQSLLQIDNRKRVLHASPTQQEWNSSGMDSATSSAPSPSSIDDVFRAEPDSGPISGRFPLQLGLFNTLSPNARMNATLSWKDKISSALSFTGFRSRSSKKKSGQAETFDVAADAPNVPPLPEFLRTMIGASQAASPSESDDVEQETSSTTRERLSRFFSHPSTLSPSPHVQDVDMGDTSSEANTYATRTTGDQPFRPPMRERVSTIADRKITQAVPRDLLSVVASHPYGMSSHLSLQEPEFPIMLRSPLKNTAGASEKVARPLFDTGYAKSHTSPASADVPFTEMKSEMLWEGEEVDCYGRCLELLRQHGVEVWMRDREGPGFHCRLEDPGQSNNFRYTGTIHFRVGVTAIGNLPTSVTWSVTKISIFLEDGPSERFHQLVGKLQSAYASARTQ